MTKCHINGCNNETIDGDRYCLRCDNELYDAMCEAVEERQRRGEE